MAELALPVNFKADRIEDGKVIVYDVPIFAVCEKQGIHFDEAWIDDAVKYHANGEKNGAAWAMHIHHTGEDGRTVLPAGAWKNTRKGLIKTKDGDLVQGVIADLVFTDEEAARRAKLGQLLWRSPEIPLTAATREKPPRFKSLALLDRDAPHNDDLPVLTFAQNGSVPFGKSPTIRASWLRTDAEPVLAFAETSDSIFALMEPEAMAETKQDKDPQAPLKFEDGDSPADDTPKESDGEGGSGWKSKFDELKATEVPADEIPGFISALREFADSMEPTPEAPEEPEENPMENEPSDPTEIPMKHDDPVVAQLSEKVVQLRADLEADRRVREQENLQREYESAVDDGERRLRSRGITREDIVKFADEDPLSRKAAAVKRFVETMEAKVLPRDADFLDHIDHAAGAQQNVPDEILKFQEQGPEAYEAALGVYRAWKMEPSERQQRIPLGRYIELWQARTNGQFVTSI